LSEGDVRLPKLFRQTVPQRWPCGGKTAVTALNVNIVYVLMCGNLAAVRFGLLILAKRLVAKTGFLRQSSGWLEDHLQNNVQCVEHDIKL